MIELLDLSRSRLRSSGISEDLVSRMEKVLKENGRVLIWMNRRGARRAFLCEDCGYMFSCSRCDLPLALHTSPKSKLLCHHCALEIPIPDTCPHCHGSKFKGVGIGIQEIEAGLARIFPGSSILRLDSDASASDKNYLCGVKESDIIISTELLHKIDAGHFSLVVFPMIENELTATDFDTEERLYINARFAFSHADDAFIQTYSPKLPIVEDLLNGNYRSFLERTLKERKQFQYPPYAEIAYIKISDRNEGKVFDTIAKLKNKLDIIGWEMGFQGNVFLDSKEIYTKRADEFTGKIVIKGETIGPLLDTLRMEIMRNPHIKLERK